MIFRVAALILAGLIAQNLTGAGVRKDVLFVAQINMTQAA